MKSHFHKRHTRTTESEHGRREASRQAHEKEMYRNGNNARSKISKIAARCRRVDNTEELGSIPLTKIEIWTRKEMLANREASEITRIEN